MERNVNNLIGYNLEAADGGIGEVADFYFDDDTWTIRYLVVATGGWLSGRKVLISPHALVQHSWASGVFRANLNREQVRNSPAIDTDKPVSRQQEEELVNYHTWQPYWGTGFYRGGVWGIIREEKTSETGDQHLRSCKEVIGYQIRTTEGDMGHVNDFIMDDQTWKIFYLVVDTHNRIGGKKVLSAVPHIREVQWENSKIVMDMTSAKPQPLTNKKAVSNERS
jgi:uncharacterized protein YrrD